MVIPSRILEGINNSELDAKDYYEVYGKEEIDSALKELQKSDAEILTKYTPEAMHKAVDSKLNKKNNVIRIPTSAFRMVTYAAAAVFIAAIAIPVGLTSYKAKTPTETIRSKGPASSYSKEQSLLLYKQNGKTAEPIQEGYIAKEGDRIQIAYQAGQNDYGIIFSVDGNGNITRHFPEDSWTSEQLKHSKDGIPLDFSYELDNAPDFECFILVSSNEKFSLQDIQERIKNKTDLKYLKKLSYLPKHTYGTTFILEK